MSDLNVTDIWRSFDWWRKKWNALQVPLGPSNLHNRALEGVSSGVFGAKGQSAVQGTCVQRHGAHVKFHYKLEHTKVKSFEFLQMDHVNVFTEWPSTGPQRPWCNLHNFCTMASNSKRTWNFPQKTLKTSAMGSIQLILTEKFRKILQEGGQNQGFHDLGPLRSCAHNIVLLRSG